MTQRFIIRGRLPGLNEFILAYCGNRYSGAGMKKEAQKLVELEIRAAKLKPVKIPIWIRYTFCEPNMRRDKDNVASFAMKVIQDALVEERIIPNDGWKEIEGWDADFEVDKDEPRIEVELVEVER